MLLRRNFMKRQRLELSIEADGRIKAIYSDDLRPLLDLGEATIRRASSVEPCGTEWVVDLSSVGGPAELGPFKLREKALEAEVEWLKRNWL